ncbi:hypothetical protein VQH23_16360 [Pararoseomonas sp. SCSIO 73927]|uniref:hypothetical protein n=1 Tax=Pararoseomonas sp. SCSIO 73927 TaxID=3114537 RepID=UPI0030CBD750
MSTPPDGYARVDRIMEMLDPSDGVRRVGIGITTSTGSKVVFLTVERALELGIYGAYRRRTLVPLPLE